MQIQIQIQIQMQTFLLDRVIGEGAFSTVYLARDRSSLKEVAIKVCSKELIIKEKKNEVINLIKVKNHCFDNPYIIVEGDHEGERGDEPDNCQLEPGSSLFCSPGNNTLLRMNLHLHM